jgi:hypothetical protein
MSHNDYVNLLRDYVRAGRAPKDPEEPVAWLVEAVRWARKHGGLPDGGTVQAHTVRLWTALERVQPRFLKDLEQLAAVEEMVRCYPEAHRRAKKAELPPEEYRRQFPESDN